jgi:putative membrane protein
MLKQATAVWVCLSVAIAVTAALIPSVDIDGGVFSLLGVAALFGLVNAIIGPILRLLSLPLLLITFGLFALVINAALLGITAGLSDVLDVGGFFSVVVAAILISVISALLGFFAERLVMRPPSTAVGTPTGGHSA